MARPRTPRFLQVLALGLVLAIAATAATLVPPFLPGDAVSAPQPDGHLGPDANAPGIRATFLAGGGS